MHIDISRNDFLSCHSVSTVNAWNLHMPPVNFGSISADYQSIKYYIQSLGWFEIDDNGTAVTCN